jgi:hypothetical protein
LVWLAPCGVNRTSARSAFIFLRKAGLTRSGEAFFFSLSLIAL